MLDTINGVFSLFAAPFKVAETVGFIKGAAYGAGCTAVVFVSLGVWVRLIGRKSNAPSN